MPLLLLRYLLRAFRYAALGAFLLGVLTACGPGSPLSNVAVSTSVITPNGSGASSVALITYQVNRPALVSIVFSDSAGKVYTFRHKEPRTPGQYEARFTGTYAPEASKPDRRVLPNGRYTYTVSAQTDSGTAAEVRGTIEVRDADTTPPLLQEVAVLPETFSPNGDGEDDEAVVNYFLTKESWATVFVEGPDGSFHLLEPESEKIARLYSVRWDGTAGERLLKDGAYTLHIRARDAAGNVTDYAQPITLNGGGRPMLEITGVRFSPLALPVGGTLNVEVKVKNTGEAPLPSQGPDSGTPYDTVENYLRFKGTDDEPLFYERNGKWRVGVMWSTAASAYPVRWGWGDRVLQPGEEITITGTIKLQGFRTPYVTFWAGVIQEGVGYPGGAVGHKQIAISY